MYGEMELSAVCSANESSASMPSCLTGSGEAARSCSSASPPSLGVESPGAGNVWYRKDERRDSKSEVGMGEPAWKDVEDRGADAPLGMDGRGRTMAANGVTLR